MSTAKKPSSPKDTPVWTLFLLIGLIVVVTVLLIVFAANALKTNDVFRPEIVLPLVVITGVVALLATLAITAATFGLFEISDPKQALGLPSGSIQAVIALSLILIFAVVALYASGETGTEQFESTGLTSAQYEAIPAEQVVSAKRTRAEGEIAYDVVRSIEDPGARNINTQLLTTVSTLVVAVAGFYFGSKSVQEGGEVAIAAAGPTRSLSLETPVSPAKTPKGEPLKGIKLQSAPPGAQLRWTVEGSDTGSLVRLEDGTFVYKPGEKMKAGDSATLQFSQVDDPTASAALTVEIVDPTPTPDPAAVPDATDGGSHSRKKAAKPKRKARNPQGAKNPPTAPPAAEAHERPAAPVPRQPPSAATPPSEPPQQPEPPPPAGAA